MSSLVLAEIKILRKTNGATKPLINYRFPRLFLLALWSQWCQRRVILSDMTPCRQYCLHLQGSPTRDTISYHTHHYEPLYSYTATNLNRFTERIICLSLRIFIHGFNSETLHNETLVQNITNVVLQSSGPSCSQHTPHIVCDKEIL